MATFARLSAQLLVFDPLASDLGTQVSPSQPPQRRNIAQITASTSAGGTCINDAVLHFMHPNLPFGGLNHSGTGSAHGVYGFRAFSHARAFLRQGPFAPMKLLFPPYTAAVRRLVNLALRWL